MSILSDPINTAEQAAEKAADHIGQASVPILLKLIDVVFSRLCRLRITIDISERP